MSFNGDGLMVDSFVVACDKEDLFYLLELSVVLCLNGNCVVLISS